MSVRLIINEYINIIVTDTTLILKKIYTFVHEIYNGMSQTKTQCKYIENNYVLKKT